MIYITGGNLFGSCGQMDNFEVNAGIKPSLRTGWDMDELPSKK